MLAGKPGLLHCHMGVGGPPRSGAPATGGNGSSAGSSSGAAAERDPLAPLFDAVAHSDVPVRMLLLPAAPGLLPAPRDVCHLMRISMCTRTPLCCNRLWMHEHIA